MSDALKLEAFKQHTNVALYTILTIDYGGGSPLRIVDGDEDIVSNGETYTAYPVEVELPSEDGNVSRARLAICNVGREVMAAIAGVGKVKVQIAIVTSLDLDTPEYGPTDFFLQEVTVNAETIQGDLVVDSYMMDAFPGVFYTPRGWPGMF